MANFRTDQFDNLPENLDRVGAHRGPKVRGRGWITFAWAVLATAVIVVGGLYVLSIFDGSIKFGLGGTTAGSTATPSGTPTPVITPVDQSDAPIASRNITVTVLNGTDIVGLQNQGRRQADRPGLERHRHRQLHGHQHQEHDRLLLRRGRQGCRARHPADPRRAVHPVQQRLPRIVDHGRRRQRLQGLNRPRCTPAACPVSTPCFWHV